MRATTTAMITSDLIRSRLARDAGIAQPAGQAGRAVAE